MALVPPALKPEADRMEALSPEDLPKVEALVTEDDTPVDNLFWQMPTSGCFIPCISHRSCLMRSSAWTCRPQPMYGPSGIAPISSGNTANRRTW
jgi:hypothetical protein